MKKIIIPYIIALLCAGAVCTQDFFLNVIDWLSSLTMKLNYNWFTVLVVIFMSFGCGYMLKINWRKYNYSHILIATLVFFVITCLYYRFISDCYKFVFIIDKIAYVDVLWVFATALVIEAIINKTTKKPNFNNKNNPILLDLPIETPNEDEFDYYTEALHIANTLSQLPENQAVSVAVLSPWGNGKTSFVNLIKYAINNGNKNNPIFEPIIIEFNPRQSKNIASIQEDFFKALIDAIPNNAIIRNKINKYLENIGIQDIHPVAKVFTRVIKTTKEFATNEVNNALDLLGKRLVVFIDDFDRLTDSEIIEVLKLIDKNAAFRHTIFITAYDEYAVSNALKKYESSKGISYIDKFFTLRFHLPLRSDISIVNVMYKLLQKSISSEIDLKSIMTKHFGIISECIKNLRDMKNFYNMFQMDYIFNSKHEINFEEYFLLELMKFRYYDDYCNLYKKEYIENTSIFQRTDALYALKKEFSKDVNGKEPDGEQPRSINILRSIFANYKSHDDYGFSTNKPSFRSVQYFRYFDMYFTNRSYGHIPAEDLESLYTMQDNKDIVKLYKKIIQQKAQNDIVDFLRCQDWQDITPKGTLTKEKTFKQFVKLVFLYSAITNDDDTHIHSLQLQLLYKPNFDDKGYNGMDKQSYIEYLLNIIYDHEFIDHIPIAFLMNITHTLVPHKEPKNEDTDNFMLKSDDVKKKNLELFKKYIKTQHQYSASLSSTYRLCVDCIDNNRLIIMKEANDIMRGFLQNDKSNEYLKDFLVFNNQDERHISVVFKDPFFKQIFPITNEGDLFEKYVKDSLPEEDENKKEILAYLEKYRKAGSYITGHYYVREDNPEPTHMEIIKGLEF